jgi:hypothetical protein
MTYKMDRADWNGRTRSTEMKKFEFIGNRNASHYDGRARFQSRPHGGEIRDIRTYLHRFLYTSFVFYLGG